MPHDDRVLQRSRDLERVVDVVAKSDLADVRYGAAAVMPSEIQRVTLVPVSGEQRLIVLPHPRAAEHPMNQEDRRFRARRSRSFDRNREVANVFEFQLGSEQWVAGGGAYVTLTPHFPPLTPHRDVIAMLPMMEPYR